MNRIPESKAETPATERSHPAKPPEQEPSDLVDPGRTPKFASPKSSKVLLNSLLVLGALLAIWGFIERLGWLWSILLMLLVGGGWIVLAVYGDHLLEQGRYDQALRLVRVLTMSGGERSRLRASVLMDAGQYEEAERILRGIIDQVVGAKVTTLMRIKTCFDLEDLGEALMERGRFEEAQQCFRRAARMYPYHSGWATGMAETLLRQGIFPQSALAHAERAFNLFQRGMERNITRSRAGGILATKAWALAACGCGAEAQEAIDAALKSPARKTKGPLAEVHYKAGMSFVALSDYRGAEEHFARGAEIDPAGRWGRLCADALRRQRQTAQVSVEG